MVARRRRAAIIVLILIFVPDHHQSFSCVFTERINNSGYDGGTTSGVMFWFLVAARSASC